MLIGNTNDGTVYKINDGQQSPNLRAGALRPSTVVVGCAIRS